MATGLHNNKSYGLISRALVGVEKKKNIYIYIYNIMIRWHFGMR